MQLGNYVQYLIAMAVALSFMVQSLMPSGYMPNFKAGKIFEMTICFGTDQKTVLVDENMNIVQQDNQSHSNDKHSDTKPCFFSSFPTTTIASADFIAGQVEHLIYEAYVETDDTQHIVIFDTRPYFSQGPPVLLS